MQQTTMFRKTLRLLHENDVLERLILIGGWVLAVYRDSYTDTKEIPVLRTMDIDFLIPFPDNKGLHVDVGDLLSGIGFDLARGYPSGVEKYVHPELEVEFIVPARGRSSEDVLPVRQLGVIAQPLRFMSLLTEHVMKTHVDGIPVQVPRPAAFALHKLIVSTYRRKPEKRQRDQQTGEMLLNFCAMNDDEAALVQKLLKDMPEGWQKRLWRGLSETGQAKLKLMTNAAER